MGKIIRKIIKSTDRPSEAQIREIEAASRLTENFDEDSPELSYNDMLEMVKAAEEKRNSRKKELVTLRISAATLDKAKAVGKGYTSFLSRLVENAINDKDLVARSL